MRWRWYNFAFYLLCCLRDHETNIDHLVQWIKAPVTSLMPTRDRLARWLDLTECYCDLMKKRSDPPAATQPLRAWWRTY